MRDAADKDLKQRYITMIRMLVQKVVVGPTPGHQPAELAIHGRIASILAAMEATTILERQFELRKQHAYLEGIDSGRPIHGAETKRVPRRLRGGTLCSVDLLGKIYKSQWLRGQDLNLRPSGYEPDELPGCSTRVMF